MAAVKCRLVRCLRNNTLPPATRVLQRSFPPASGASVRCHAAAAAAAASPAAPSTHSTRLQFELLADCADADLAIHLQHISPTNRGLFASENFSRIRALDQPITSSLCVCTPPEADGQWFQGYIASWQQQHAALPPLLLRFLADNQESEFVRLCIFLLWARECDVELWTRYVGLLPKGRELCCLLNYTQEEAMELQIASLQEEVEKQKAALRDSGLRLLNRTNGFLKSLDLPESMEDFLWAAGVVQSRAVYWVLEDEEVLMLPAVADLVNHSFQPNCELQLSPDFDRLHINPLRPLAQGEEVTVAYLPEATSGDLMRNYGFVLQGNPFDQLSFRDVDLGGVKLRGELLGHAFKAQGHFYNQSIRLGGAPPASRAEAISRNRTRSALLSLPVTEDVPTLASQGPTANLPKLTRDELGLQRQAAQILKDAAQHMQYAFGTSLEADQQMLQVSSSLGLSPRMVTAIECRLEHKQLLATVNDVLEAYLKYLRDQSA